MGFLVGVASIVADPASAQQANRPKRIAIVMGFAREDPVWQLYVGTLVHNLRQLGWSEDRNLLIDYRFTSEDSNQTRQIAEEVVASEPDLIYVTTNPVVSAVTKATRKIPIIFSWVSDTVGSGFVSNLARPGGNISGFHNFEPALGGKWLDVLKQVAPGVNRVAVIHVPEIAANVAFLRVVEATSQPFGLKVIPAGVRVASDIERTLAAFAGEPNGGLIVTPSPLTATRRDMIIRAAELHKLPAIYPFRFYAERGGLASYGIDQVEQLTGVASYIDRVLRGESVGELPVQLPTKFQLVINLKAAKAINLEVSPALTARFDDVIE
jgi:putative tryptophan/tyrosine transport system substrate-binding protein